MRTPLDDGGSAGNAALVAAMLMPPRSATTIVSRPRVLELLETAARGPVTIVSGEAAAGKTSIVVDWINSTAPDRPIAWLTVPRDLGDPILFWRYVVAAIEPLGVDNADLELALGDNELPDERWLTELANRIAAVPDDPVIVLDDLQELNTADGWSTLLAFLDRTPTTLHVLLLSRSKPPAELTRWQVSGRLAEIDSADLRFSNEETRALVDAEGVGLSDADVALLVERTEGWAGGLRLALLSMRHTTDPGAFVARFAADDELVSTYLFREVIERQPPELRAFLLDISVLDRVTPALCDALRERDDSDELLERCRAESLFLSEFSTSGAYRLHGMFAQLLRATLDMTDPNRLQAVRGRASTVFEELGDFRTAIEQAVDAGDFTRAGALITRHSAELARRGRFDEIRSWLTLLPDDTTSVPPEAVLGLAMTLSICGRPREALDLLDRRDAYEGSPRTRFAFTLARVVAHCLDGDVETMARAADILGDSVPIGDLALPFEPRRLGSCYTGMGTCLAGDLETSRASLEQAAERQDDPNDPNVNYVEAPGWLARVDHAEGDLDRSERHARECLARNSRLGGADTAVVTPAYLALADIAWERNKLDDTDVLLGKARQSVRPLLWFAVLVQLSTSRLLASRGELHAARQQLIECGQTYLRGDSSPILRTLLAETAVELALRAGDADDARRWARTYEDSTDRPLPISLQLRLSALSGDENLATIVENAVATKQHLPRQIDTLLAGAELIASVGDDQGCRELVSRATHLAEPSGFIRRFLDGGTNVHAALRALAATPHRGDDAPIATRFFLESLVSAANIAVTDERRPKSQNEVLVEPLTKREVQVLGLLADGLAYADIGTQLFVSRNTVKSHASHIYTKLGVSGRTDAAAAARQLGLA